MNLYDLIIYSREDGEPIAKYSAEHLTCFALKDGYLVVDSSQVTGLSKYSADKVGFYFQGR